VAISASGNSPNVLKAIELAKQHGAITIGWSGYEGGKLAQLVDLSIVVRNHCIEQIEDIHLMLEHMVVQALRRLVQNHPFKLQEVVAVERV
jgi:D-sedoheptulose 7-phosphate isomerase